MRSKKPEDFPSLLVIKRDKLPPTAVTQKQATLRRAQDEENQDKTFCALDMGSYRELGCIPN